MADFGIGNSANNFGRSAGLLANTLANRPTQAAEGTIFIDVDTLIMYRYNSFVEFPDWQIIGGGGSAFTGANNGLNIDYGPVELGGELTKSTTIDISDYNFNFNDGQGWNFNMVTGQMLLGLTEDEDGNNRYIEINQSYIRNFVLQSDDYSYVNIEQGYSYYNIFINQNYPEFDTSNEYAALEINYNNSTKLNLFYFDNNTGDTYYSEFTLSNTMGAEGNFLVRYNFSNIPVFTDNADAIANGLQVGDLYRHDNPLEAGDQLRIVH
jgi:hypothetical protein